VLLRVSIIMHGDFQVSRRKLIEFVTISVVIRRTTHLYQAILHHYLI